MNSPSYLANECVCYTVLLFEQDSVFAARDFAYCSLLYINRSIFPDLKQNVQVSTNLQEFY